jgi:drug/metabolite transporter (DMT)-like permease
MSNAFTRPLSRTVIALICCLLWGSAFPALKIIYREFQLVPGDTGGLLLLAGGRFMTASLILFLLGGKRVRPIFTETNISLMKLGTMVFFIALLQTTMQYYFFYSGVSRIPGSVASVVNSSRVFFTLILAHLFFKDDRVTVRKSLGILLGMGGILLVNRSSGGGYLSLGVFFILGANLSGASGGILVKKTSPHISPIFLTGVQLFIGSLMLFILTLFIKPISHFTLTPLGMVIFIYTAFLSAIAFVLWTYLLKYNRAGEMGFYQFAIPLFGSLLSILFLSEPFSPSLIFSLLLVCGGIVLVNLNSSRQKPKIEE